MTRIRKTTGEVNGEKLPALDVGQATKLFMPTQDLDEILYSSYAKKFEYGVTNKSNWLESFVDANMDKLKQNLKDPSTALSAMREIGKVVKETQAYYNSKKQTDSDFSGYLLRKMLFPWQQKVFDSRAKRKTMCCGRRSGKTYSVVQQALDHCLQGPIISPDGTKKKRQAAIIGLTVEKTANLYWQNIKDAIEKCHISTLKIDNGSYKVTFSNGNTLELLGNSTKAEREKIRGADYSFIAIDECQSQQGMYYLCEDILKPILKGTDGTLLLLGTGPISAGGYWEKSINDESFEHFHATMEDNPTIPNYEHALEDVLNENHWTRDNVTFRREYLGEVCYDTQRMIYPERTYYTELPKDFKPKYCYIGCDFGWADYSSFAPILIDEQGEGYLIKEWKQNKTSATAIVAKAKELTGYFHNTYNIPMEDIKIVADTSHQQISQDMYNQGILNIQNAYKLDESYQIARVAEGLATGYLHIQKNEPFDQECDALVWQWNEEKGCVTYQIDDKAFHPDIADSVKYAYNQYLSDRNTAS